jgi:2-keto-4-pentenoate hydratase/2-oxohepta-3-ene-1,7-dioic acid hydratase in catechol pathway
MKLIRFRCAGRTVRGRLNPDGSASPLLHASPDDPHFPLEMAFGPERLPVERLLPPILPADILGIGLNYREHAKEGKSEPPPVPMLFIKAGGCVSGPGDVIPVPRLSEQIDFEGELAVVIGRTAKDVPRERALEYVFGYTIANDVTARDWQRDKKLGGGQFARGKSFDGFCPLGPHIVTADEIPDPSKLWIKTWVNGTLMQDQGTADMIFDVPALIESLSSTMTLRPGAVILTGTPAGVGYARTPPVWLKAGDTVRIEIGPARAGGPAGAGQGIGTLENPVGRA